MNFKVGQKVVCIDGKKPGFASPLVEGQVYTVETVPFKGLLTLREVAVPDGWVGFRAVRFRPAVEPKTDIKIFENSLKDTRVNEPA
jgi:hypothetical protein